MEVCGRLHAPPTLMEEQTLVPIEKETLWAPDPAWTFQRIANSLASTRNKTWIIQHTQTSVSSKHKQTTLWLAWEWGYHVRGHKITNFCAVPACCVVNGTQQYSTTSYNTTAFSTYLCVLLSAAHISSPSKLHDIYSDFCTTMFLIFNAQEEWCTICMHAYFSSTTTPKFYQSSYTGH